MFENAITQAYLGVSYMYAVFRLAQEPLSALTVIKYFDSIWKQFPWETRLLFRFLFTYIEEINSVTRKCHIISF